MNRTFPVMSFIALLVAALFAVPTSIYAESPAAGPFAVGFTHLTYVDPQRAPTQPGAAPTDAAERGRPIALSIWYPADPGRVGPDAPRASYPVMPLDPEGETMPSAAWARFGSPPVFREPEASARGPFPLLVFSHGLGGDASEQVSLGSWLASHGIVFAATYHPGEEIDPENPLKFPFAEMLHHRPADMSFLLSRLLEKSRTPGDLLHGVVDPDRIAAGGFSMGGYTAMALAGGDDDVREIADLPPGLKGNYSWMNLSGTGLAETKVRPDPRIKALVLFSASGWVLRLRELQRIAIPSLSIGEEWDSLAAQNGGLEEAASMLARQHRGLSGGAAYRVDVLNTVHQSFTDACRILALSRDGTLAMMPPDAAAGMYAKLCEPCTDSAVVQGILARYTLAFLNAHLGGDPAYARILGPGGDQAREPQVEFFTAEDGPLEAGGSDWPDVSVYRRHR